jgi:hypothetical protein
MTAHWQTAALSLFVLGALLFFNWYVLKTPSMKTFSRVHNNSHATLSAHSESTICSAYSSSLGPGAMICCTNTSVSFTTLMLYATFVDNNRMSGCVELDWTCGGCTSQTGRVCGGTYKYMCGLAQQEVSCQVCISNGNFVFTEQVLLYAYPY